MQSPTNVVGKRVGAFIIDGLISFAITAIAWFALTTSLPVGCPSGGGGIEINGHCRGFLVGQEGNQTAWYLISLGAGLLLFIVLQGLTGKTPGKAMLGIKVVKEDGSPPGIGRAFLRYILWIVDAFPYIIPYLVGFITALNSQRNQRVGDMAAATFVVDKNYNGPVPAPGQLAGAPQYGAPQYGAPQQGWAPPAAAPGPPPPPQPQQPAAQKADWYPDPHGQARLRYWDGQRWTEHTSA